GANAVRASAEFDFDPSARNFTLNGAGAAPAPNILSSGFSTFVVDSNGVPQVDNTNTTPQCQIQHTGTATSFCTVCVAGGGNKEMIIGAPNANTVYSAANNSVANTNGPHNPFIIGGGGSYTGPLAGLDTTASWVIRSPGRLNACPTCAANC
ncbi:MAG TPA: hypothetical protein VNV86_17370, partial [Candidatus Acidoferrum sp.]|nr:hypothetical protein [Candidatus Acidoferrum sp.]